MQPVLYRSGSEVRTDQRNAQGNLANPALQPMEPRRLRPAVSELAISNEQLAITQSAERLRRKPPKILGTRQPLRPTGSRLSQPPKKNLTRSRGVAEDVREVLNKKAGVSSRFSFYSFTIRCVIIYGR